MSHRAIVMNYIVSALKYRPQKFEEVVGQQAVTNTLKNAIAKGHLAQALLFTGPRGVGKTTCARILAKEINKTEDTAADEDFAFNIFELDAASNNGVDDIRTLIEQVRIPPQTGKYKVYIIDEVHMLTQAAFNAFLKTLEEPPEHVIFILATTEKHKIIPTILSRCQIYDFKRINAFDIKEHLKKIAQKEGLEADDDALFLIAQKADGALRDALSMFDKVASYANGKITRKIVSESMSILDYDAYFKLTDLILKNDIPGVLNYFNELLHQGFDAHLIIAGLAGHFRDLLVAKEPKTVELLEVSDNIKQHYLKQSKQMDFTFLLKAIDLTTKTDIDYKLSKSPHLLVELALMKLASLNFGDEAKKKIDIIPSSHFKDTVKVVEAYKNSFTGPTKVEEETPLQENNNKTSETKEKPKKSEGTGITISGILKKKRELEEKNRILKGQKLPTDDFSPEDFEKYWLEYLDKLRANKEKNLLSILTIDRHPRIIDHQIHLTLTSEALKKELEQTKEKILKFLRYNLNNYDIDFVISVKEEKKQEVIYSKKDKFRKLLKKNPDLLYLKQKFKIDI